MDASTIVVELVKALAWPVAGVSLGLIFRGEIRILLSKIKKGKLGPAEFEFEQAVAALKQDVSKEATGITPQISGSAIRLASTEPRAAILNSWLEVQAEVDKLIEATPSVSARQSSGSYSLRVLHYRLREKPEYIDMYNELKALRNQAVHEVDFSPRQESVLNYIELSSRLVSVLRDLPREA